MLFGRRARVEIADLEISEPRINFTVDRQATDARASCRVSIYNLAPERDQAIYDRGVALRLLAGYTDRLGVLFDGTVQTIRRQRASQARVTVIEGSDQVAQAQLLGGVTMRSYDGEQSVRQLVQDVVQQDLELAVGPLDAIPADAVIENWEWDSTSRAALTSLAKRVGCTWYEDAGLIRFNRERSAQPDGDTVDVSEATGLIGTPTITEAGVEARMLLNPAVAVGGILNIESELLAGTYKVAGVRHTGDNWAAAQSFVTVADLRDLEQ